MNWGCPMIGSVIDGRYRITGTIGAGGMGSVYEAEHARTGRRVAVKLIKVDEIRSSPQAIARFQREAQAAGAIDTQHITQVLDFGTDPATAAPYLVMEFLTGEDLRTLLQRLGPLPPNLALRIVAQACIGLQKANEAQVIHRDIKPANIFVAKRDLGEHIVKLLDFGIAKIAVDPTNEHATPDLTQAGRLIGSPLYMSPEQVRGSKQLDHRADIWSLGIVLYELLAKRTPYQDFAGLAEIVVAICHETPKPVQNLAPWVPAGAAAIIDRALRRAPDERFQTAKAMFDAICAMLPNGWTITDDMLVPLSNHETQPVAERLASFSTSAMTDLVPTGATHTMNVDIARPNLTSLQPLAKSTTHVTASSPKGTLTRTGTGESFFLRSEMLLGRSPASDLRINEPRVSSEHARLRWTGTSWEIRDLGSKNGTFVEGRRLAAGERATLMTRDTFGLGGAAAPAPVFMVVDASAPALSARSIRTGVVRIAADGFLTLPDDDNPEVCIVEARDGQWTIETDDMARLASENETITVGGEAWILDVPHVATSTLAAESVTPMLESIGLGFAVNLDETHIAVTVTCFGKEIPLPARNHHRLLLALAHEQLRSAVLPFAERGWLDRHRVCETLVMTEQRLHVDICQARREFAELGIQGAVNIIEGRPGTKSLRLGVEHIVMTRTA